MIFAAKRHKELCEVLRHHDKLYYQDDSPEISDAEYDRLRSEIEALELAHPELVTPDSPTQKVGYVVQKGFKEVIHSKPMLSLDKVHSVKELRIWAEKTEKRFKDIPEKARLQILKEMQESKLKYAAKHGNNPWPLFDPLSRGDKVIIKGYGTPDSYGEILTDTSNPFDMVYVKSNGLAIKIMASNLRPQ